MLTLLLVEDDTMLGEELRDFLSNFFDEVTLFFEAKSALAWLQSNQADVIMSDICMPGMDGLTFLKEVRKHHPHQALIVISAYPQTDYLIESIELGIYRFLVKPFDSQKLIQTMSELTASLRQNETPQEPKVLHLGPSVHYDFERNALHVGKEEVLLTKKECELLHLLALNRHHFLSEEAICNTLWREEKASSSTIRALIRRLRSKLGSVDFIKNYRGFGYRLSTEIPN